MNDSSFTSLGLSETLLSAVSAQGYEDPTPIQAAAIPPVLAGRDLLGCAQTGTGKTAAFALPIIQLLAASPRRAAPRGCRALVVAPTRELAAQIDESFGAYGRGSRTSHACIFGGVGKRPQVQALGRGVDVLIATPGRLLDLHSEGQLKLDGVEIVVLDEADRMLDMGFIHDVRKIMALLPAKRQTLLFSATMPQDIASLAGKALRDPVRVSIAPEKPAVELIDQAVAFVEKGDKRAYLASLIEAQEATRAIVFTRTKHGADRLVKGLEASGISAAAIHANKSQNNRTRTMEGFRSGDIRVLVATDLAARGIDVDGVTHVYNYELPDVPETYVHRIGRTARAGARGSAVALCDSEEKPLLKAIEKLLRKPIPIAAGPVYASASEAAARAPKLEPRAAGERPEGRERGAPGRRGPREGERAARPQAEQRGARRGEGRGERRPAQPKAAAPGRRRPAGAPERRPGGQRGRSLAS